MTVPFRLVFKARGGVQVDHLVVFNCQVMPRLLQMCDLHEVAGSDGLADVAVVFARIEVCANHLQPHPSSDARLQASGLLQKGLKEVKAAKLRIVKLISKGCR